MLLQLQPMISLRATIFAGLLAIPFLSSPCEAAPIAYANLVTASNPLVYYRFNESSGTTASDSSVNGNNGVYTNGPVQNQAGFGVGSDSAVTFDGTDDYLNSTKLGNFGSTLGSTGFTLEFILKSTSTVQSRMFGTVNGPSGSTATALLIDNNTNSGGAATIGSTRLFLRSESNSALTVTTTTNFYDGNYHHLAFVYDPANGTVGDRLIGYLDGVRVTPAFAGTSPTGGFVDFTSNFYFGGADDRGNTDASREFASTFDEAAIYGTPLSAATIMSHYQAAAIPEPSVLLGLGFTILGGLGWRYRRQSPSK